MRLHGPVRPDDRSLAGLLDLLLCWAAGEVLARVLHLPLPGPVVGLVLLLAVLGVQSSRGGGGEVRSGPVADLLLRHLALLFVPAGVGVITYLSLLREQAVPVAFGLVLPLVVGVAGTGLVVDRLLRRRA
ncbi:MAG: putative effector of murein hydrolase LrgA [Frankiales bacterium]|nr:putative effector of murein hydrolase LrgA [Frankiales bacterium]